MDEQQDQLERMVDIFKALGDPVRLRLLGAIAGRPRTGKELAQEVSVGAPTISHHMDRLIGAGLVSVRRDGQSRVYSLNQATLQSFARLAKPAIPESVGEGDVEHDAESAVRTKVLRDFFDGERLKQIPAQRKKRVIALQHLVERFSADREYTEREVNTILKTAHEDFATLRRELIDYGFMSRAGGVYRVARDIPQRSEQVNQEITGDETVWLNRLLKSAINLEKQRSS